MGEALAAVQDEVVQRASHGLDDENTFWLTVLVLAIIGATVVGASWVWRRADSPTDALGRRGTDPSIWDIAESQRAMVRILMTLEERTAKMQEALMETKMLLDQLERRIEQHRGDMANKLDSIHERCLSHGANLRR